MSKVVCCFLGHRKIIETKALKQQLCKTIEDLILNENVDTFLFGSKSQFNSLCYTQVSELRKKHNYIKRIYVRAEFPEINDNYMSYLLECYEDTYYPRTAIGAGNAVYLKRNHEMINKSDICVFYYNKECLPSNRKSGTKSALDYALRKNKNIIVLPR